MSTSPSHNDLLRFVQETPSDELMKKHLKVVFQVYQKQFGEVCTGCPTKIAGYINRIKNLNHSKMEKSKSNYKLKKGAIIPIPGTSDAYSNENLTDEVALKFLSKNPNRKKLFTQLPDNIDALLGGNKSDKGDATHVKVGDREYTVEEGTAILGQIGVNTSAKTVDGVQRRFDELKAAEKKKLDELFEVAGNINVDTNVNADVDGPGASEIPQGEDPGSLSNVDKVASDAKTVSPKSTSVAKGKI